MALNDLFANVSFNDLLSQILSSSGPGVAIPGLTSLPPPLYPPPAPAVQVGSAPMGGMAPPLPRSALGLDATSALHPTVYPLESLRDRPYVADFEANYHRGMASVGVPNYPVLPVSASSLRNAAAGMTQQHNTMFPAAGTMQGTTSLHDSELGRLLANLDKPNNAALGGGGMSLVGQQQLACGHQTQGQNGQVGGPSTTSAGSILDEYLNAAAGTTSGTDITSKPPVSAGWPPLHGSGPQEQISASAGTQGLTSLSRGVLPAVSELVSFINDSTSLNYDDKVLLVSEILKNGLTTAGSGGGGGSEDPNSALADLLSSFDAGSGAGQRAQPESSFSANTMAKQHCPRQGQTGPAEERDIQLSSRKQEGKRLRTVENKLRDSSSDMEVYTFSDGKSPKKQKRSHRKRSYSRRSSDGDISSDKLQRHSFDGDRKNKPVRDSLPHKGKKKNRRASRQQSRSRTPSSPRKRSSRRQKIQKGKSSTRRRSVKRTARSPIKVTRRFVSSQSRSRGASRSLSSPVIEREIECASSTHLRSSARKRSPIYKSSRPSLETRSRSRSVSPSQDTSQGRYEDKSRVYLKRVTAALQNSASKPRFDTTAGQHSRDKGEIDSKTKNGGDICRTSNARRSPLEDRRSEGKSGRLHLSEKIKSPNYALREKDVMDGSKRSAAEMFQEVIQGLSTRPGGVGDAKKLSTGWKSKRLSKVSDEPKEKEHSRRSTPPARKTRRQDNKSGRKGESVGGTTFEKQFIEKVRRGLSPSTVVHCERRYNLEAFVYCFDGEDCVLSNMYIPCEYRGIIVDSKPYSGGVLSYYYFRKLSHFGMTGAATECSMLESPAEILKLKCVAFEDFAVSRRASPLSVAEMGNKWRSLNGLDIMKAALRAKFTDPEYSDLAEQLLATEDRLLVLTYDNRFWGIGMNRDEFKAHMERHEVEALDLFNSFQPASDDSSVPSPLGENRLGLLLMELRDQLRAERDHLTSQASIIVDPTLFANAYSLESEAWPPLQHLHPRGGFERLDEEENHWGFTDSSRRSVDMRRFDDGRFQECEPFINPDVLPREHVAWPRDSCDNPPVMALSPDRDVSRPRSSSFLMTAPWRSRSGSQKVVDRPFAKQGFARGPAPRPSEAANQLWRAKAGLKISSDAFTANERWRERAGWNINSQNNNDVRSNKESRHLETPITYLKKDKTAFEESIRNAQRQANDILLQHTKTFSGYSKLILPVPFSDVKRATTFFEISVNNFRHFSIFHYLFDCMFRSFGNAQIIRRTLAQRKPSNEIIQQVRSVQANRNVLGVHIHEQMLQWELTHGVVTLNAALACLFRTYPAMLEELLETGEDYLVECELSDRMWGAGMSMEKIDQRYTDAASAGAEFVERYGTLVSGGWSGQTRPQHGLNLFGRILMHQRNKHNRQRSSVPPRDHNSDSRGNSRTRSGRPNNRLKGSNYTCSDAVLKATSDVLGGIPEGVRTSLTTSSSRGERGHGHHAAVAKYLNDNVLRQPAEKNPGDYRATVSSSSKSNDFVLFQDPPFHQDCSTSPEYASDAESVVVVDWA